MSTFPSSDSSRAPQNYMVWSIISLVLTFATCCLCYTIPALGTAIVALVFSIKVNGALNAGDAQGAQKASKNAKLWNLITLGLFALGVVIWLIAFFAMGGMEGQQEQMEMLQKILDQQKTN